MHTGLIDGKRVHWWKGTGRRVDFGDDDAYAAGRDESKALRKRDDTTARGEEWERHRAEVEAEMEASFQKHRKEYIDIVRAAYEQEGFPQWCSGAAETAVDALMADGVKFVRMGTWDDDPHEFDPDCACSRCGDIRQRCREGGGRYCDGKGATYFYDDEEPEKTGDPGRSV